MTITVLGLWVLWPIPTGRMPLSADHTVHLTRIWMVSEQLAAGHLRGWSPVWFFGTPVGELYPILGDWLVVLIRALGAFWPSWGTAYAFGLTIAFLSQGWVLLRIGPTLGLGPWPGWIAASLMLTDVGQYREGGWIYTIEYGVWPQALATALAWLALGETVRALGESDPKRARILMMGAAAAFGASLLTHPMSMLVLALGLVVTLLIYVVRTSARGVVVIRVSMIAVLGTALAAWWLIPMLEHRAWMASYGWLWQPLDWMVKHALEGEFTQNMPPLVGFLIAVGLLAVAVGGNRASRTLCGLGLILWLLASRDVLWALRLDRVSVGFAHVQYQRFLIAAKPGLFLAAGVVVAWFPYLAVRAWQRGARRWGLAFGFFGAALGMVGAQAQVRTMVAHHVGTPQMVRIPSAPDFESHYQAFLAWAREQWDERDGFYRLSFAAPRNAHWFMDSPVYTHTPTYKMGFTPGDNFVHKPEASDDTILDRLGVRWIVRRGPPRPSTRSFGSIQVEPRDFEGPYVPAQIRGPGRVEVLESNGDQTDLTVRVSGAGPRSVLVFSISGYPRWQLSHDGDVVSWYEVPVTADEPTATPAERRAGQWRAGKARGSDGTEPTLLATAAKDGVYQLRFRHWTLTDTIGALVTLLGLFVLLPWVGRWVGRRLEPALDNLARAIEKPKIWWIGVLGLIVATLTWLAWVHRQGAQQEQLRALGWIDEAAGDVAHLRPGFIKTDMGIRPGVVSTGRKDGRATFPAVSLDDSLTGWIGVDDDHGQMRVRGRATLLIEARPEGTHEWQVLYQARIPHRPGRQWLDVDTGSLAGTTVDLRVTLDRKGRPPDMAFDLDLGEFGR